jgi:hypothetical protein
LIEVQAIQPDRRKKNFYGYSIVIKSLVIIVNAGEDNIVEFPLRGEWTAINTPAHRIPSHGTDMFGQRYAFDFIRISRKPLMYLSSKSELHHAFGHVSVKECYGWAQPIYSPFDGEVVRVGDGWPEITELNSLRDSFNLLFHRPRINGDDFRPLAGNYVIIHSERFSALLAHLRNGSVKVAAGQHVKTGDLLGEVGNSGNTTGPHLHFQLMKGDNPITANGLPCRFRSYETYRVKSWETVTNGIPDRLERIRYQVESSGMISQGAEEKV